ncbi:ICP4 [Pteropodid alphaherpesvirus 1]|uniref:ICP4 n=1 Tax=Pteropodid alphaherpesvirus 1 TaxID=1343901 RepID=A0A060PYC4_9ALPH|nr:ICP4 [Pteropodid alphaherpesvirus 1]YP_009042131.1 ICP4 [Pteropodid alphaherpesvirus 1]BAP00738.1 ICP4 [Pteropodid alphaherpesvirus 1]BAP00748.1 ICP4 [Pteropodid alphaherpesvirus 1]
MSARLSQSFKRSCGAVFNAPSTIESEDLHHHTRSRDFEEPDREPPAMPSTASPPGHPNASPDRGAARDTGASPRSDDGAVERDEEVPSQQVALLASLVEETARSIGEAARPPVRDAWALAPPPTPAMRDASEEEERLWVASEPPAGFVAPRRGPNIRKTPRVQPGDAPRGVYPGPREPLSPRPNESLAYSSSSPASSDSSSSSSDEDEDEDERPERPEPARPVEAQPQDPPEPPADAPKKRRRRAAPACPGRSERRRVRAAVAGRDSTGRFTAGQPQAVPLDEEDASGAFYARYQDGYATGEPWPGAEPAPAGRVLYGGLGDSRPGLWGTPEVAEARRRFEGASAPAPVWAPELGDVARQYALLTRLLYSPNLEAMGWLQNPRVAPGDVELDHACFQSTGAQRNSSSFITGTVARAVPHLGYAMLAGRFGWGLAHVAAAVAMSRRYDRAQKGFLITSLRRAYAPLLARENALLRGDAAPADEPAAGERTLPPGYGTAGIMAAQQRLASAPPTPGDRVEEPDAAAAAGLVADCLDACRAILEGLAEAFGGDLAAVPGLPAARPCAPPRPREDASPGLPPHADEARLRAWRRELRLVRDAVAVMRLRGEFQVAGGSEAAVAAVRAVCVVAGALGPRLAREGRRAPARAAAAVDRLLRNQSLRPLLAGALEEGEEGADLGEGRKRKSPAPARPAAAPWPSKKSRRAPPSGAPAAQAPEPEPAPAARRPAALATRPSGGNPPSGGWRRQPPGPSHTPAPGQAALDAYCPPAVVAELTEHALFPSAWRAALMFDPSALASLAARSAASEPGSGRLFGPLRVSGPLRRAAAWMRQIPDPEDVRVVVLYAPLPGEELGGPAPSPPAWTTERGGLSFLLAALGNRLCGPDTAAWAGRWTGPPDVRALGAQGVLLLSVRDLAFTGAVEFLGLLASASERRLIVINAVPEAEWPADGPTISQQHVYLPCSVTPRAQCDLRWPDAPDLARAALTSGRVFGPGVFARAEAAFARLYPGEAPLRLARARNVRYCVDSRLGEQTAVPLSPREYRRAILPALDSRAASSRLGDAMGPGAPDFCEGEAHSHRACLRWGLGAPLRPVYLALPRGAAAEGPAAVPAALRDFCARALLEPEEDAAPYRLKAGDALPPAPGVRWASAVGRLDTVLSVAGAVTVLSPEGGASASPAAPARCEPDVWGADSGEEDV